MSQKQFGAITIVVLKLIDCAASDESPNADSYRAFMRPIGIGLSLEENLLECLQTYAGFIPNLDLLKGSLHFLGGGNSFLESQVDANRFSVAAVASH